MDASKHLHHKRARSHAQEALTLEGVRAGNRLPTTVYKHQAHEAQRFHDHGVRHPYDTWACPFIIVEWAFKHGEGVKTYLRMKNPGKKRGGSDAIPIYSSSSWP